MSFTSNPLADKFEQQFKNQLIRGTRLLDRGKVTEALPLLESAYRLKPEHFETMVNLGGAYIMLGRYKLAVPVLEKASELYPLEPQVWINLGAAYLGNPILASDEQQRNALASFNRAARLDPYAHNIEYNIGLIHRDRGEVDLALQAFERALRINPDDPDARRLIEKLRS
ncbi:MAG: tetratricopeptide repeat protein [Chloroflexi bacterium]|nr:tetratricopeptide repeat protein [Chloroflexota bacterium]